VPRRGAKSEAPLSDVAPEPMERATVRRILAAPGGQGAVHPEGTRV